MEELNKYSSAVQLHMAMCTQFTLEHARFSYIFKNTSMKIQFFIVISHDAFLAAPAHAL